MTLLEKLESLRRRHLEVEDGWFSCAAAPNYRGLDTSGECDCGAQEHNATLDECIQSLRAANEKFRQVIAGGAKR